MVSLYEKDFYQWTVEQSAYLRLGKGEWVDWQNLAEEIADLGRRAKQDLENRLGVLLAHLLRWQL